MTRCSSGSGSAAAAAVALALGALMVLGPVAAAAAATVAPPPSLAPAFRTVVAPCGGCPVWSTGPQPSPLNPGSGEAAAAALSPDGRFLAVTGTSIGDAVTVLYLAAAGLPLWQTAEPRTGWSGFESGTDIAFAPDGARLFVTADAGGGVVATVALDATTGAVVWRAVVRGEELVVTPDGSSVIVAGDKGLIALDAGTGIQRWRVPGTFEALEVTPDGTVVVAARLGYIVGAYATADGAAQWVRDFDVPVDALNRFERPLDVAVDAAAGRAYVAGWALLWDSRFTGEFGVLVAFDLSSGAVAWERHPAGAGSSAALLPDLVVLGGADVHGRVTVWAYRPDGAFAWSGHSGQGGEVVALAANAAGTAVYAGGAAFAGASAEPRLSAFDASNGALLWSALPFLGRGAILDLAVGDENALLYTTGYGILSSGYTAYRTVAHATAELPSALR